MLSVFFFGEMYAECAVALVNTGQDDNCVCFKDLLGPLHTPPGSHVYSLWSVAVKQRMYYMMCLCTRFSNDMISLVNVCTYVICMYALYKDLTRTYIWGSEERKRKWIG